MKRFAAVLLVSGALVAGCGGGSKSSTPNAYQLAHQACQTSGQNAADLAAQAAAIDPKYAQLAADEKALAANIAAQQAGGTDEQNLAGVTGQEGTGPGSSVQVMTDCANMATGLLPGQ